MSSWIALARASKQGKASFCSKSAEEIEEMLQQNANWPTHQEDMEGHKPICVKHQGSAKQTKSQTGTPCVTAVAGGELHIPAPIFSTSM